MLQKSIYLKSQLLLSSTDYAIFYNPEHFLQVNAKRSINGSGKDAAESFIL